MCLFGHLVALFLRCRVLGRPVEKDQQNPEDLAINRDTPLVSPQSRKTDSNKLDVKIAHQPGQPDEPHTEIFSSPENVGRHTSEASSDIRIMLVYWIRLIL